MSFKNKKIIQDVVAMRRLSAILWFELSTTILLILNFYWVFTLAIVIVAALLFTPYMLYILFKEKRYGWHAILILMVVIPLVVILLIFHDYILLSSWLLLPVILIYSYYFLLKYSVSDWLSEYYAHEDYEEQKRESAKRKQDELKWSP